MKRYASVRVPVLPFALTRTTKWSDSEGSASRQLWCLIAALLGIYWIAYCCGILNIKPMDITALAAVVILLHCGAMFYTKIRVSDRLARLFRGMMELLLLAFFSGGLSYAAAALGRPLTDDMLDAWDRRLGFDWREWLSVLDAHPWVNVVLATAYHSMIPQIVCAVIVLVTVRSYRVLDTFLMAFGIAASVAVVVSGIMPALSPLVYYGILPSDHPNIVLAVPTEFADHVRALRDGSMRVIDLGGAQGLVTFPSFHTASAVLLMLAFRGVPYVRWPALVLNGLMLLSVPLEGSHYLVDLLAGIVLAVTAWHFAQLTLPRVSRDRTIMPVGP